MNTLKKVVCICLCLCMILSCNNEFYAATGTENSSSEDIQGQKKVLFIGNSFTYYTKNKIGIKAILQDMVKANNEKLYIKTITNDGAYLRYYSDLVLAYQDYHQSVMQAIMGEQWDYIVLQDNTTAPVDSYETEMLPSVSKLLDYIGLYQDDAQVLMYYPTAYNVTSTGMSAHDLQMYTSYAMTRLKNATGIENVPVGQNASHFQKIHPEISIIGPDNKHPNFAGYYLAAASFFYKFFGRIPQNNASQIKNCTLTDAQITALNEVVDDGHMTLNTNKCDMTQGQSVQLSTVGNVGNVRWHSLNNEVATVSDTGVVTAVAPGRTAIIAEDDNGSMDANDIAVDEAVVKSLSFAKSQYLVGIGDKIALLPREATHIPDSYLSWKSSNKAIAAVSGNGVVTALKPGAVKITVSSKLNAAISASYTLGIQCVGTKNLVYSISAANANTASVYLSWNKSYGATKYNVYRSTSVNGNYQIIGTSSSTSYTDKTAAVGNNYYYKVSAIASNIITEGQASNSVHIFVPAKVLKGELKTGSTAYKLTWKKLSNVDGYEVYRCKKKNGKYVLVKDITSSKKVTYSDKDVKSLIKANKKIYKNAQTKLKKNKKLKYVTLKYKTYYYKVRAYKKINNVKYYGTFSDVTALTAKKLYAKKSNTKK